MAELSSLIKKRGHLKSRLTFFKSYLERKSETTRDDALAHELTEKINNFSGIIVEFNEIQKQIEFLSDDLQQLEERDDFECLFFQLLGQAKSLLHTLKNSVGSDSTRGSTEGSSVGARESSEPQIKLPTINLPRFNGDLGIFQEFHDTYLALIHNNSSLNNIQKFHYLRAALEGEAAEVLHCMTISSANYEVAWGLICDRYKNKRLLIHNHIKSIFDLPNMNKENYSQLRELQDGLTKNLRSLQAMDLTDSQLLESVLIYILTKKLDSKTLRDWEGFKTNNKEDLPLLEDLQTFLKDRCMVLEVLNKTTTNERQTINKRTTSMVASTVACFYCKGSHSIYACEDFNNLTIADRTVEIKKARRCLNCLRKGHFADKCTSGSCKKCRHKHNTLLHSNCVESTPVTSQQNHSQLALSSSISSNNVLLATALVTVLDSNSRPHQCRALLDCGSQSNFIRSDLVKRLNLPTQSTSLSVIGISQAPKHINFSCLVNITAKRGSFKGNVPCLVVDNICGEVPFQPVQVSGIPSHLPLADPTFHCPGDIDILLGANCFWSLLCVGQVRINNSNLILQKTRLGWIVSGPVDQTPPTRTICNLSTNFEVQRQLERFWEIESFEVPNQFVSPCEEHFRETTLRNELGRFIVSVPLKDSYSKLGNSYDSAERRFLALERRLAKDPLTKTRYIEFMQTYEVLGHMTRIPNADKNEGYYIPHHSVTNERSETTKLRVVFDASAVSTSGYSLNDIQQVGPTIQNDLFSILIRFRRHLYAVCADVEKMYRQVLILPEERIYQKILWRDDPNQPIKIFTLNTITYGTAAAPFLATRVLNELGNLCEASQPNIADVIHKDFYVDDMLTGANTISEAINLAKDVSKVLAQGCFHLRKWLSNSSAVTEALQEREASIEINKDMSEEGAVTLGLHWSPKTDQFICKVDIKNVHRTPSKRIILSTISRMFDPLGFMSPITITAKIILQQLWLDKVSWDETLPQHTATLWYEYCSNFENFSEFRIPRCVLGSNCSSIRLHGFADASEKAYGACVYVVSSNSENTNSFLLCAKTRVAPLKAISIPRLELCAAHLLSKLITKVNRTMDRNFDDINLWSDSSIVLAWLRTPPLSLKTFVRNRVSDIQSLTENARWRHVRSGDNPADLLSRGINPQSLIDKSIWWNGPSWICQSPNQWPKQANENTSDFPVPELKNQTTVLISRQTELPINVTKFSSLTRLIRTFAYCRRFVQNCKTKSKDSRLTGCLSVSELNESLLAILKSIQAVEFHEDIRKIKRFGIVDNRSPILNLNPFLDNDLLRVGGRLQLSNFEYDKKNPILLPKGHHFTKLVFQHEHLRLGHAGPALLLASVRDKYWPINGRSTAREVFRKCIRCFRINPHSRTPIMGNIPIARLSQSFPFINTGMDYAGPIFIRNKLGRGFKLIKAYICVFVCLTTRAIHLEVVSDLTTEAFLAALRRFISRRGKPTNLYSDNGTNFVGANRELSELRAFLRQNQNSICESSNNEGISFHFIPPRSPHFGGMAEAGVKSTKLHLKKILGNAHLTYEGIHTTLTQIEAILNSRPLSPLSTSPVDFEPLTPAHFLIGRKLTALPEHNLEDINVSRLSIFQRAQQLAQHFWRRWSKEFVSELQQRNKWKTPIPNIDTGALVLVKEDNLPPLRWLLGRVVQVHPGNDQQVRVVSVRTVRGVIKRAISRLCVLPSES